jgi:O-acetyl-ADP-ribose deacetylase (regulator of RNase III)
MRPVASGNGGFPAMGQLVAEKGDITRYAVDAIVNAANVELAAGGGVCGAIFRAAGPGLAEACGAVAPCPTGAARLTPGFALPARWIIHAVGPVWRGGGAGEDEALGSCYRSIWAIARAEGMARVAVPAISTGIYGFPLERATRIAVAATRAALADADIQAIFVCFDDDVLRAYRTALGDARA